MSVYCPSCGRSIPNDSKICAYCGKSIPSHGLIEVPEQKEKDKSKTILIIAIVVIFLLIVPIAIAATVYVYVSGMIGTSPNTSPNLQLVKDSINRKLTVASADPSNLRWVDFIVVVTGQNETWTSNQGVAAGVGQLVTSFPSSITITAGDIIQLHSYDSTYTWWDSLTVTIRHEPTNTLIGTWEFN